MLATWRAGLITALSTRARAAAPFVDDAQPVALLVGVPNGSAADAVARECAGIPTPC